MYKRARFEFREGVALSVRLQFLAELAGKLEVAGRKFSESPGFSIELTARSSATVDVWQPGKSKVLFHELRGAEARELLHVTSPRQFHQRSKDLREDEDA